MEKKFSKPNKIQGHLVGAQTKKLLKSEKNIENLPFRKLFSSFFSIVHRPNDQMKNVWV